MKCLILLFFCGVFGELPVPTVLPALQLETLTDLPREGFGNFNTQKTIQARQNELEDDFEIVITDDSETATPIDLSTENQLPAMAEIPSTQLSDENCTFENMEYKACGPRCYPTCAFQPREATRRARVNCGPASLTGCNAGCFCESGFVRFNDQCILPTDCPSKCLGKIKKTI